MKALIPFGIFALLICIAGWCIHEPVSFGYGFGLLVGGFVATIINRLYNS